MPLIVVLLYDLICVGGKTGRKSSADEGHWCYGTLQCYCTMKLSLGYVITTCMNNETLYPFLLIGMQPLHDLKHHQLLVKALLLFRFY